jgi:hypothetical protein
MSKSISFRVELTFESNVERDEDIMNVAQNIARAIVAETNGQGIAPQDGDTYLEVVRVTPWYINETVIEHAV